MQSEASGIKRAKPDANALLVRVVDGLGCPVLGNLFPDLVHLPSGEHWRRICYLSAAGSYAFAGLPDGPYRLHLTAAGFLPANIDLILTGSTRRHLSVQLRSERWPEQLVFDVGDELSGWPDSHSRKHIALPVEFHEKGFPSDASRLIFETDRDPRVWHAFAGSLKEQPGIGLFEQHFAQRLVYLGFPYGESSGTTKQFWRLVDARSRLALMLVALFSSPCIAAYTMIPSQVEVGPVVLQVLDGLDLPEIDAVLLALARVLAPWRMPIEEAARSQIRSLNLLLPPGISVGMHRTRGRIVPQRPAQLGMGFDEGSDLRDTAVRRLVQLIQIVTGTVAALSGSDSQGK